MAELAEVKKDQKYSLLGATYLFTPVAIETSGAIGPRSRVFLRELGRRVKVGKWRTQSDQLPTPMTLSGCAAVGMLQ